MNKRSGTVLVAVIALAVVVGGGSSLALTAATTPPAIAAEDSSAALAAAPKAARPQTVVSLTFDEGEASQLTAANAMDSLGLKGTFYIVSGFVGAAGHLTYDDLSALAAAGHEIGGHTVAHPDLAAQPLDEVARQVCNDRSALLSWGFPVRSFAYPFGSSNPDDEKVVRDCGYNSARSLGDIRSRFGCSDCGYTETMPPKNLYDTKALAQVDSPWTLTDLQAAVTNGEREGGWVQLSFNDVCDSGCGDLSITPAVFTEFVNWLAPRAESKNTIVKTVGSVVGGPVAPAVSGPVTPAPGPGVNGIVNSGMEELTPGTNIPRCWMLGGFGANTPTFWTSSPGLGGGAASTILMTGYADGDAKLLPQFDLGQCSPTVNPGSRYSLRAWYTSTTVTQFAVYLRNSAGAWHYWTSSPWFGATDEATQAVWTTPPIPEGMFGISFGLNILADGQLTSDDYSLYDSNGAPDPEAGIEVPTPDAAPEVNGQVEVHVAPDGLGGVAPGTAAGTDAG